MSFKESLENTKAATEIISELIKVAGDNESVKEAGEHFGKSVLTISKAINNTLLPLAAVNFAFDKARQYFSEKFQNDLSDKLKDVPQINIINPKSSIAGPALQALSFSHEEELLKNMYLKLLCSAMDNRVSEKVHPAFIEVIRQISSDEVLIIEELKRKFLKQGLIFEESLIKGAPISGSSYIYSQWIDFCKKLGIDDNIQADAYYHNLIRLGIIIERTDAESKYKPEGGNSYGTWSAEVNTIVENFVLITSFGELFIKICTNEIKE